jgi:hypothetical protein
MTRVIATWLNSTQVATLVAQHLDSDIQPSTLLSQTKISCQAQFNSMHDFSALMSLATEGSSWGQLLTGDIDCGDYNQAKIIIVVQDRYARQSAAVLRAWIATLAANLEPKTGGGKLQSISVSTRNIRMEQAMKTGLLATAICVTAGVLLKFKVAG